MVCSTFISLGAIVLIPQNINCIKFSSKPNVKIQITQINTSRLFYCYKHSFDSYFLFLSSLLEQPYSCKDPKRDSNLIPYKISSYFLKYLTNLMIFHYGSKVNPYNENHIEKMHVLAS